MASLRPIKKMSGDNFVVLSKIATINELEEDANKNISCFLFRQKYWQFLDIFTNEDINRLLEIIKLCKKKEFFFRFDAVFKHSQYNHILLTSQPKMEN